MFSLEKVWMLLTKYGFMFGEGVKYTLLLSAVTVLFGAIFGAIVCLCKMSKFKPLSWLASAYIEIIRGTPLLVQLYFFYFILPQLIGSDFSQFTSITIALVVNSAGYVAEIIRSGIQAVDSGQSEAARSLGMNGLQTMIFIVFPQAIKNILPSLANEFVTVIKETSLASTFFIGDLMTQYRKISGSMFLILEPLVICAVIYFILTFTLSKLISLLERRLAAGD